MMRGCVSDNRAGLLKVNNASLCEKNRLFLSDAVRKTESDRKSAMIKMNSRGKENVSTGEPEMWETTGDVASPR